jgi:cobalt/nickel transport system permease protein
LAHIPDGVLAAPVLVTGALVTSVVVAMAVRKLDYERIPQAAVLSAALFISSLITIPAGPSSVHLLLNGLMGVALGWSAAPAILVALVLQAVFFGYGGLLVLGVNVMNIALPALLCALLFSHQIRHTERPFFWGVAAGGTGVLLTGLMVSTTIALTGPGFTTAAQVILATYLPLVIVEAAVTGAIVSFVVRVAPDLLFVREQQYG